jgi:drug/metabolite transporter (DMT)-like permease
MAGSGVAWSAYSLLGRRASSPLPATAAAFVVAAPVALAGLGAAFATGALRIDARGAALAATSGAVTSGLGYAAWYAALSSLGITRAAVIQLAVPIVAGLGGAVWLGEAPSVRLLAAGAVTLTGIALATVPRAPPREPRGDAAQRGPHPPA